MALKLEQVLTKLEGQEQITIDRTSIELGTLGISLIAEYNHKPGKFIVHLRRKECSLDYVWTFPAESISGTISA